MHTPLSTGHFHFARAALVRQVADDAADAEFKFSTEGENSQVYPARVPSELLASALRQYGRGKSPNPSRCEQEHNGGRVHESDRSPKRAKGHRLRDSHWLEYRRVAYVCAGSTGRFDKRSARKSRSCLRAGPDDDFFGA
jgi:hypothetical protein